MIFNNSSDIQNEYILKSKNSKSSNVLGSSVMIRNNHEAYRLLILEDITKIKNLEDSQKEQERMMAQQAKMAEMGDMIGAIAHQWRQPLNSINAASMKLRFLYELGKLENTNLAETTEFIESQSSKMSDTINDFLNFFKPSKERDMFSVNEVVENIKKMLGVQLENRNITLISDIEEDLMIYGYKNELEHVILNLITNARDAFEGKNIHPQIIELTAKSSGDKISISVEDGAGGIPEKIIDKIFNPYFSTKPTDKGTGIGLYMSKNIIEKGFHGKISVENSENGARFEITLKRGRDG
jgi:signal transduction histidine kinase